ncbi:initiator tRNA phosphoribosyl transferase [Rhizodiscina lignyota]|uniref:Initiator tRNA phosphoribosyl transferase n=1 Tax=Rhizodiscina lignyota TaxID=1504668 RepID=A0A9P4I500_9PEZI|nr:initiator tRNA phosphoribosyl transferase [Rhizodiscina lignyota]
MDFRDYDGLEDVLLPTSSLGQVLRSLRRSTLSIPNRLRSIQADASFVQEVAGAYGLPLIANERCGSWYIPPERRRERVYFKSTDGHAGTWAFSLRRLNLQLLEVIAEAGGCIIVDSTRRGKVMPDALSKTVPIWCAVLNRILFPQLRDAHALHTPPRCVSSSEHDQVKSLLSHFSDQLQGIKLDVEGLRKLIKKPLRPLWVTQDSSLPVEPPQFTDFLPIILCTSSRRVAEGDVAADGYIQGAGDDNEGWSLGLSADVFWQNQTILLNASEDSLPALIQELMDGSSGPHSVTAATPTLIRNTTWLYTAHDQVLHDRLKYEAFDLIIHCSITPNCEVADRMQKRYLYLKCRGHKLGSRDLREELSKLHTCLEPNSLPPRTLVCCQTGTDLSLGVALALLCLQAVSEVSNNDLSLRAGRIEKSMPITKDVIRHRLSWIAASCPNAQPSRATLQSVNAFLMNGNPSQANDIR